MKKTTLLVFAVLIAIIATACNSLNNVKDSLTSGCTISASEFGSIFSTYEFANVSICQTNHTEETCHLLSSDAKYAKCAKGYVKECIGDFQDIYYYTHEAFSEDAASLPCLIGEEPKTK